MLGAVEPRTRWVVTATVVSLAAAAGWVTTPLPASPSDTDTVAHVAILVTFTFPLGAVVAVAAAYFGTTRRALAIGSWVATVILTGWLALATAVTAFWSGDLGCGPGADPCETVAIHRAIVCSVALAEIAACALIERRLRARWANGPS